MRLLHFDDNGKVSLTAEFLRKDKKPAYAILSHTWGKEEVTFYDLAAGKGMSKAGWDKIRFCMKQAARDGLHFSWVDTCCIKKDDTTELQYSINSMFRWYKEAAKCYVLMTDVSTSGLNWQDAFERSRWFTRGWTLQELLAPSHIEFFSMDGEMLGSLNELKEVVQKITRLPLSALSGAQLHDFGVEERLSWTETRQTMREEDKAYSLLGIFNVFIPLNYGEGEENAFRRLRTEILERKYDTIASIRLSQDELNCLKSLSFFEQDNRYHDIHSARGTCEWLLKHPNYRRWTDNHCGLFWVKGNPGVGKSVLMKHAAESLGKSDQAGLVLSCFVHGQGTELQRTPLGIFRAILNNLLRHFPKELGNLTKRFIEHNERHGTHAGSWAWSQSELERELENLLKQQAENRPITIFIDALDELGEGPARHMLKFFRDLNRTVYEAKRRARFCVSSRHYPIIGHDNIPFVNVEQENSGDLARYIRERIQEIDSAAIREDIGQELLSKAQGAFQWVYLVTESIIANDLIGLNDRALLQQIESCPEDLGELYRALLQAGSERDKRRTLALFRWVLYAERPLTASALRDALAVSANDRCKSFGELKEEPGWSDSAEAFGRQIKHISKGLVKLQQLESGGWASEIQLIHQSVADFLLDETLDPIGTRDRKAAHLQVAKVCLRYITYDEILLASTLRHTRVLNTFLPQFPLAAYAVDYTVEHMARAGDLVSFAPSLVEAFAATRDRYHRIPLLVAAVGGHERLLRHLLAIKPTDVETCDCTGLTAPLAALKTAQATHRYGPVGILMTVGRYSRPSLALTPFFMELCQMAQLHNFWAAEGTDGATRSFLSPEYVNVNAADHRGRTLLWHAAENGHDTLVEILLRTKAVEVDAPDEDGTTPMHRAAWYGHRRVAELLLYTGNASAIWGHPTAIDWAMERGHSAVVKLILDTGQVPLDHYRKHNRSYLRGIISSGNAAIIRMFLDKGSFRLNDRTDYAPLPTMLWWATLNWDLENLGQSEIDVFKLVLDTGEVDLEYKNNKGRTLLIWAAEWGLEPIVTLLLDTGKVNVNAKDWRSRTPLMRARDEGHENIAKLLLAHGARE